ncbi:hypothetical protein VP1G_10131 [Cytospora mali]|uniref:Uncharacterized protein n=1 Tax=Cytospora mali TaxID=578113 RepID=A0A194VGL6_CYTMA|nr:hypothetical protein VP1G_10131 [Valsa mali var. pyri (nom. inval.)]
MEKPTAENHSTDKPCMDKSAPEKFAAEDTTADGLCTDKSAPEKFAAENTTADGAFTDASAVENSTAEDTTTESFTAENSTTDLSALTEKLSTEKNLFPIDFMKFPLEIRNMIADHVVTQPIPECGFCPLTMTLSQPAIAQVNTELRERTLARYYEGREFCLQVPRDDTKRKHAEFLQDEIMHRWIQSCPGYPKKVREMLEEAADEVVADFEECLETMDDLEFVDYAHVESISVVFSGRFRINRTGYLYNWAPRSCIIGFRAYRGEKRCSEDRRPRNQINENGELDWEDFDEVREAYARKLRRMDSEFGDLRFEDIAMHPAVQYIVKEMCLLGVAGAPAMEYVEAVLTEWNCYGSRKILGLPAFEWDDMDDLSPLPSDKDLGYIMQLPNLTIYDYTNLRIIRMIPYEFNASIVNAEERHCQLVNNDTCSATANELENASQDQKKTVDLVLKTDDIHVSCKVRIRLYMLSYETSYRLFTPIHQKPFRFLNLPPELRNYIYRLALVQPATTDLAAPQPALTRVNKQVRAEALSIYYAENKFSLLLGRPTPFSWIWGGDEFSRRYDRFVAMMNALPNQPGRNSFRFIREVSVLVFGREGYVGFRMSMTDALQQCRKVRIGAGSSGGEGPLDWADGTAVRAAYLVALGTSLNAGRWPGPEDWTGRQRSFVQYAVDLLCCVARECPLASRNVYLSDGRVGF